MKKTTSLRPFYLAAFLATVTLGAVLSIGVPVFAVKKFGAGFLFLGLVGALGALCYVPLVIFFGRLIDRFNRKLLLSLGCCIFGLTYFLMSRVTELWQIPLVYPLGSVGMAMFWPSLHSWLSLGLDKERLSRSLGVFNISWSAGWMVGPLIGGFLSDMDYKFPFIFTSALMILIIVILARQPLVLEKAEEGKKSVDLPLEEVEIAKRNKFWRVALLANFMSWFFMGVMRNLFPRLGIVELGMNAVTIGILIFCFGFSQTIIFIILRRNQRWHYRLTSLLFFQALGLLGLLIILFFNSAVLFGIAFGLLGLMGGMTYFSSIFYSLHGYLDKGKRSGIHEACIGSGAFLGPLVGGTFAHVSGNPKMPYLVAFLFVALAIVIEIRIVKPKWKK